MTTDVDSLVREADPALSGIPSAHSKEANWIWSRVDPVTHATHRSRRRGIAVSISIIAIAAVVVAFVVFQVAPSPLTPSSAAALDRLAQVAGDQPPPVLGTGKWLHSTYGASVDISLFASGGTQAPDSAATVPVTFGVWVSTDRTCMEATFGTPRFASTVDQQAWEAADLAVQPDVNDSPICVSGDGGALGAIDVSSLPTDPPTLAKELETGTTGIAALDTVASGASGGNPGFERAVYLLVGPTIGATAQFRSALLRSMADMPGISSLGDQATRSAGNGMGFAATNETGQSTEVILSPTTGAILEARGLNDLPYLPIEMSLWSSFTQGRPAPENKVTMQWLDPTSSPAVIDTPPPGFSGGLTPPAVER